MLKIGALSFINALPFFSPFTEKKVAYDGRLAFGMPTQINAQLEKGDIDIGLISSASFIANRDRYILLTNLGIGTSRCMQSVCLYTTCPIAELSNKVIAIPEESTTSVQLLKVLCNHFWKVSPKCVQFPQTASIAEQLAKCDGALVIGDACLTSSIPSHCHVTDLAQSWYEHTQKPFVFSVFATRCETWMQEPELVRDFHQKLFSAYDYSKANFSATLEHAKSRTGLALDHLQNYYSTLDYYLESEHFQGLELFMRLKS